MSFNKDDASNRIQPTELQNPTSLPFEEPEEVIRSLSSSSSSNTSNNNRTITLKDSNPRPSLPHRSSTWPSPDPTIPFHDPPLNSQASVPRQGGGGSHLRDNSLSHRIGQSISRRRESIRLAAKRISTMINGPGDETFRSIPIIPERKDPLVDSQTNSPYIKNSITTSRYSFLNFLPKQLWYQFSKIANIYFLFVAALQAIPGFSPTGQFTTIIPLSVFISIAIAHEGFDDFRRHKQDQVENDKECSVLRVYRSNDANGTSGRFGVWNKMKWKQLQVGDIVVVKAQEWVPADLLLLHSKGENGCCFIETAALDGETNLKQRQALKETNVLESKDALANFEATVTTENPNQDLYNFDGSIELPDGRILGLSNDQILLRGTVLRNTAEIYGLVIFTGEQTKLRMNASKNVRTKAPTIQNLMNRVVIIIFTFVLFLSVTCTILAALWDRYVGSRSWYLIGADRMMHTKLFSFIILFNTMIPISLYVTMEIIKLAQAYFINCDLEMYHQETDTPAEARTSTINEELGQVKYLFSDKTGTLTDNIMLFRKISVGGRAFLHDLDLRRIEEEELIAALKQPRKTLRSHRGFSLSFRRSRHGGSVSESSDSIQMVSLRRTESNRSGHFSIIAPTTTGPSPLYARDSISRSSRSTRRSKEGSGGGGGGGGGGGQIRSTLDLLTIMQHQTDTPFSERARFFLLAIALCHTCVPEIDKETDEVFYQAASPDEFALVTAAKELGYVVVDKSMSSVSLLINNEGPVGLNKPNKVTSTYETYQILNVIEFSSKRKRMSVVYRLPDGRICLLCKGADSIILERLRNPKKSGQKGKGALGGDRREKPRSYKSDLKADSDNPNSNLDMPDDQLGALKSETPPPFASHNISHGRSHSVKSEQSVIDLFPIRDESWVYSETLFHVQQFATEGLRTLLYAHRFLDETEYHTWNKLFQEASTAIVDRQKKLEQVAEMIEHDLEITGATAIEDKLQNGVPETIDKLRRAGIKVWMLTGDKRETAINIGYSCSLIKSFSKTLIIDSTIPDLNSMLKRASKHVGNGRARHTVVVVDGATLMVIEKDVELMESFVTLGILCDAVICCRVSPAQKALVVRSIRERLKDTVTLAIGDGANDIAMIQEAHVGIGITGREGLQAARSSDYSIAQFRFLTSLLFVHGRWSYVRVSKFVLGTFYKCMCFYLTQGIFQLFTGFSGTSLYEAWTLSLYNTLFSSLPVIVVGMFEKDLKRETLTGVPELYQIGQRNEAFNFRLFFSWMCTGLYHAMVIVITPALLHGIFFTRELNNSGTPQLFELGLVSYTSVIFIVTSKIAYLECHNWTPITHITSFLTLCGWFLWQTVYSFVYPIGNNTVYDVHGSFQQDGKHSIFWLSVLLTVSLALMPSLALKTAKSIVLPTDVDEYQEIEKDAERLQKIIEEGERNEEEEEGDENVEVGETRMGLRGGGGGGDIGGKRDEKNKDESYYSERDMIVNSVNDSEAATPSYTDDQPRSQSKDVQPLYPEENSSSASLIYHNGSAMSLDELSSPGGLHHPNELPPYWHGER